MVGRVVEEEDLGRDDLFTAIKLEDHLPGEKPWQRWKRDLEKKMRLDQATRDLGLARVDHMTVDLAEDFGLATDLEHSYECNWVVPAALKEVRFAEPVVEGQMEDRDHRGEEAAQGVREARGDVAAEVRDHGWEAAAQGVREVTTEDGHELDVWTLLAGMGEEELYKVTIDIKGKEAPAWWLRKLELEERWRREEQAARSAGASSAPGPSTPSVPSAPRRPSTPVADGGGNEVLWRQQYDVIAKIGAERVDRPAPDAHFLGVLLCDVCTCIGLEAGGWRGPWKSPWEATHLCKECCLDMFGKEFAAREEASWAKFADLPERMSPLVVYDYLKYMARQGKPQKNKEKKARSLREGKDAQGVREGMTEDGYELDVWTLKLGMEERWRREEHAARSAGAASPPGPSTPSVPSAPRRPSISVADLKKQTEDEKAKEEPLKCHVDRPKKQPDPPASDGHKRASSHTRDLPAEDDGPPGAAAAAMRGAQCVAERRRFWLIEMFACWVFFREGMASRREDGEGSDVEDGDELPESVQKWKGPKSVRWTLRHCDLLQIDA